MAPVWEAVRDRLQRAGSANRGRVRLPALASEARLTLRGLLARDPGVFVELAALEAALVGRGVGPHLAGALAALGYPVSDEPARRRERRRSRADAHLAARDAVRSWPEGWAGEWVGEVIRAGLLRGLDVATTRDLVAAVRKVVDRLLVAAETGESIARTDLAAGLLGSAHALDRGTVLEAACVRALARVHTPGEPVDAWTMHRVQPDQVSGAVLTWALPVGPRCALGPMIATASELGVPLHLTQLALRLHPLDVHAGTVVLVAENPRVVEAAAQRRIRTPVVTTNGNPSAAVRLLLDQLLGHGAELRYHGDFDVPGLAICDRLHRLGLRPWRMTAADYRAAVAEAERDAVELPAEHRRPGPTPWDPELAIAVSELRRVVHEERLLDELLGSLP